MEIRPIKTKRDHKAALAEIEKLMDIAEPNSPEEDKLDVMTTLVYAYEEQHYPMDAPDPVEAIKFYMEQNNLRPKDLVPYLGAASRVSEVLNRRRPLSLAAIKKLHKELGIPAEALLA